MADNQYISNYNPSNTDVGRYVTELRPNDVLFGRGSGPNDHEGNIRFRQLVADRKAEYMATNHRMTKAKIAKAIVDQVFAANGRFMKKLEQNELRALGLPDGSDVWEVVGDDTIMEKAKQALRQNTQKADGRGKVSPVPPLKNKLSPVPPSKHMNKEDLKNVKNENSLMLSAMDSLDPVPILPRQQAPRAPVSVSNAFVDFEPLPISSFDGNGAERNAASMSPLTPIAVPAISNKWNEDLQRTAGSQFHSPDIIRSQGVRRGSAFMGTTNTMASGMTNAVYNRRPTEVNAEESESDEEESMLAYVRRTAEQLDNRSSQHGDPRNTSMAEIPQDSPLDRRGSLSMAELMRYHARRHSIEMRESVEMREASELRTGGVNEMLDSFNKMKTGGEMNDDARGGYDRRRSYSNDMQASVETMGTIDQMPAGSSLADMSIATMGSSTFSLYRGNESMVALDERIAQVEAEVALEQKAQGDIDSEKDDAVPPIAFFPNPSFSNFGGNPFGGGSYLTSNSSMSLSDVWSQRRKSSMSSGTTTSLFASRDELTGSLASCLPRPVGLMEEDEGLSFSDMGSSSMQMLKAAFADDSTDVHFSRQPPGSEK